MLQLRTDLLALRAQLTPDWKAIAEKQKEMVDIRVEIQKKATEAGFAGPGLCGHGTGKAGHGFQGYGTGRMGMCRMGAF